MSAAEIAFPLPSVYLDAFGRQRMSQPTTIFDYAGQYNLGTVLWQNALTGDATAVHRPDEASVRLTATSAAGDKVVRQTRQYHRYQPGKSQLILMTFVMGTAVAGFTEEIGYGDDSNGFFVRRTGDGALSFVRRSSATGTAVDTVVPQTSWSIDNRLGGFGEGVLDSTKSQILAIDLEWLGVGAVRMGFALPSGEISYCHKFEHTNTLATVYMTTANLPLRYSVENVSASTGSQAMDAICSSVVSEGGFEESRGFPFSARTGTAARSVTTALAALSIRPRLTFNSITNRSTIILTGVDVMALTKSAVFCVYYGSAITAGTWVNVDENHSTVEYNITATGFSGGICIATIFVPAAAQGTSRSPGAARSAINSRLPLALDLAGQHPTTPFADTITIVAQTAEAPDASLIFADVQWTELY